MPRHLLILLATLALQAEPTIRVVWDVAGANILGAPTPDGRYLSCVDPGSGDLALLETATGQLRRLTHKGPGAAKEFAYFSAPSRDGSRVAVAWFNEAGFYDLRVVPAEGGEPRVLFRNEESGFVQPTSWTPDNQQILTLFFRKDNISQIALVHAKTGAVKVLRSLNWVYPKRMDISPDGRWIAYDSFGGEQAGPRDIYVLAMDGSSETKVVEAPGEDLFPVWSPDGQEILFASDRDGTMGAWAVRVENGKAAGTPRLVRSNLKQFLPMGVTAKGDLYYGLRTGSSEIALMPEGGKPAVLPTRTPGRNSAPAWSHDGKRLAYLSRRGAENFGVQSVVIVVRDLDSGRERDLPARLATIASVRWSPDGEWLLASGTDGKGRAGLFRVRVRDGAIRVEVVAEGAGHGGIPGDWEPDGRVAAGEDVRAMAVSPDGKLTARASRNNVVAGGREWAVDGVTWLAWKGASLLASRGGVALSLSGEGVRRLAWPNYDGGPFSVQSKTGSIAFGAGGTHSQIWVMEHVFAPLDSQR
ncbi:MAG: PD40 domain-containing protein [Acidobacteria bacterium]|nr:PD40 domain-containing protein [Acidobacteriota bacterium]